MPTSPQSSDSSDFEGRFYQVLAEGYEPDDVIPKWDATATDFFDSTNGNHAALDSRGTPVVMLTFTPQGVKLVLDAVRYWQDHNCNSAIEMGLYVLHLLGEQVRPLLEQLPEVRDWEPFPHKVD